MHNARLRSSNCKRRRWHWMMIARSGRRSFYIFIYWIPIEFENLTIYIHTFEINGCDSTLSWINFNSIFSFTHTHTQTGRPRPNVTWYLDNTVIDESFEHREGVTRNHLTFPNIGRQHVNARFVCMASNTNLVPPTSKVLILDVNCKCPTSDAIQNQMEIHFKFWLFPALSISSETGRRTHFGQTAIRFGWQIVWHRMQELRLETGSRNYVVARNETNKTARSKCKYYLHTLLHAPISISGNDFVMNWLLTPDRLLLFVRCVSISFTREGIRFFFFCFINAICYNCWPNLL